MSSIPPANFADHILNVRYGQFITMAEDYPTTRATVDRIFDTVLTQQALTASTNDPVRILLYAHGGLVSLQHAVADVEVQCPFWINNRIFPIFFLWHTGFLESLLPRLNIAHAAVSGLGEITNAIIEAAARKLRPDWVHMQENAAAFGAQNNDAGYFAQKLSAFVASQAGKVEVHAVSHSAGSILHSYLLPQLLKKGLPGITTVQYLAPAITIAAYRQRISNVAEVVARVGESRIFAMSDALEKKDTVGPYQGSLLYLIYHALEAVDPTDLLGLQISLNGNPGVVPEADCIFSPTASSAPLDSRCNSSSHSGFHTDPETMNSLARRILAIDDAEGLPSPYSASAEAILYAQPEFTMPALTTR
jgi:hypothetical protein